MAMSKAEIDHLMFKWKERLDQLQYYPEESVFWSKQGLTKKEFLDMAMELMRDQAKFVEVVSKQEFTQEQFGVMRNLWPNDTIGIAVCKRMNELGGYEALAI